MTGSIPFIPPQMLQAKQKYQDASHSLTFSEGSTSATRVNELALNGPAFTAEPFDSSIPIPAPDIFTPLKQSARFLNSVTGQRLDSSIGIWDASKNFKLVIAYTPQSGKQTNSPDVAADSCFDSARTIDAYCRDTWNRYPIDNQAKIIRTVIHHSQVLDNAFWNRQNEAIYFGSATPGVFKPLDQNKEVFWHETGHAIDSFTVKSPNGNPVGFTYTGESGALSEHWADVTAATLTQMDQWVDVGHAKWLIAENLLDGVLPPNSRNALRSMDEKPAFIDHPILGTDTQPKLWNALLPTNVAVDDGNVHSNSGPLNHAFKKVSERIGGYSWEKPGNIWYQTLQNSRSDDGFDQFVHRTIAVAQQLYNQQVANCVQQGWSDVGFDFSKPAISAPVTIHPMANSWKTYLAVAAYLGIVGAGALSLGRNPQRINQAS